MSEAPVEAQSRNVAVVRDLIETLSESGSEAVLARTEELSDPEIEWRGVAAGRDAPGGDRVFRGYEGLRRFYAEYEETLENLRFFDLSYEAIGANVVLVRGRIEATTRGAGLPLETRIEIVYTLRDGRVLSGENFFTPGEADAVAQRLAREADRAQA